jgi:hypothetical protein
MTAPSCSRRGRARVATLALVAACAACGPSAGAASAADAPAQVSQILSGAFPGATVSLSSGGYGQTAAAVGVSAGSSTTGAPAGSGSSATTSTVQTVDVRLGRATPAGSPMADAFTWADTQWRAQLVSAAAAEVTPAITGYSVTEPDGTVPGGAGNFFQGSVRSDPTNAAIDDPGLDSISESAAVSQLDSNIATLGDALGAGAVVSSSTAVIATGSFALSATVDVASADDLAGHLGDIVDGLETGLVGGSSSLIEGLGVEVLAQGVPEVGAWEAARAGAGDLQFNPGITVGATLAPTRTFPDLTGGPAAAASGLGAAARAARPASRRLAPTAAIGGNARASHLDPLWLGLFAVAAAIAAAGLAYAVRRRRGRTGATPASPPA